VGVAAWVRIGLGTCSFRLSELQVPGVFSENRRKKVEKFELGKFATIVQTSHFTDTLLAAQLKRSS